MPEVTIDLVNEAPKYREDFAATDGKPFRHCVIRNFLQEDFLNEVLDAFPSFEAARTMGQEFLGEREAHKTQLSPCHLMPEPLQRLSLLFASDEWVVFLRKVVGLKLRSDPLQLGGGCHFMPSDARLDVHVDFNFHDRLNAYRRLNCLLFLNREWHRGWGGGIELWNADVTERSRHIEPRANTLVFFETSDHSFHGVEPITSPEGVVRQSFATYYYTTAAPRGWNGRTHSTLYHDRPAWYGHP
jgi:Rps23 Pro-64 3,4-dihydroxylase Tpa1-like proline 4-hydroxylase